MDSPPQTGPAGSYLGAGLGRRAQDRKTWTARMTYCRQMGHSLILLPHLVQVIMWPHSSRTQSMGESIQILQRFSSGRPTPPDSTGRQRWYLISITPENLLIWIWTWSKKSPNNPEYLDRASSMKERVWIVTSPQTHLSANISPDQTDLLNLYWFSVVYRFRFLYSHTKTLTLFMLSLFMSVRTGDSPEAFMALAAETKKHILVC